MAIGQAGQAGINAISELTTRTHRSPATRPAVARVRPRDEPVGVGVTAKRISVFFVGQGTLATLCEYALLILSLAMIGFAAPAMVCLVLGVALKSPYPRASGPFATWDSFARLSFVPGAFTLLLVQAFVGMLCQAFAHGAITWIVLRHDERNATKKISLLAACRAAVTSFPALLIGSLLYGGLLTLGAVGLNVPLRVLDLDLSNVGQYATTYGDALHVIALRSMDAAIPNPGSPFAEFVPRWRRGAFNELSFPEPVAYVMIDPEGHVEQMASAGLVTIPSWRPPRPPAFWLVSLGSLLAIILAETLLRFRAVMVMKPLGSQRLQRFGWLAPLAESVAFGFKHCGVIAVHVWLVRLLILGINVIFLIAPIVLIEMLVMPQAPGLIGVVLGTPILLTNLVGLTVVNALFTALSAAYDAQLYLAVTGENKPANQPLASD